MKTHSNCVWGWNKGLGMRKDYVKDFSYWHEIIFHVKHILKPEQNEALG